MAVTRGALLVATVHLDLGGVQIDREQLHRPLAPQPPVKLMPSIGERPLDPLAVHATELLGALQRRRRRRDLRDDPQAGARLVGADLFQIGEERAAHELTLGQRQHQLRRRGAPAADLHRPRPALE